MLFVFYFGLIVYVICELYSFAAANPNHTKIEVTTISSRTTLNPFHNIEKLIIQEEQKIKQLEKDKTNLSLQITKVDDDCQMKIKSYEQKYNIQSLNYSQELEIQRKVILKYDEYKLQIKREKLVINNITYEIDKQQFINLLLVQDLNMLIKRRFQGYNVKCFKYDKSETPVLEQRSFDDLMKLMPNPSTHFEKLLNRLYRLRNITADLQDDKRYLTNQLYFALTRCNEELGILQTPLTDLYNTVVQIKKNTKDIIRKSELAVREYASLVEEVFLKKKYLQNLKEYNKVLQQNLKNYIKDKQCYSHLLREQIKL